MEGDGVQQMNKAEIDTTAPFQSVKEAVMLFGERVLGSEVYGNEFKEMHDETTTMEYGYETATLSDELEETKQSLRKTREKSMQMATSLLSLQQELERAKIELQQLKIRQSIHRRQPQLDLRDIEDIKFVEDSKELTEGIVRTETTTTQKVEFQKKKYVKFANPPSVTQVVSPKPLLQRLSSLKKKKEEKKKQFVLFIKGIFLRK